MADIDYNGYQYQDVCIRPKGNSSLKQVASSDAETKRFSLKVNFDYYVDANGNLINNRGNKAMRPVIQDGDIPEGMNPVMIPEGMNPQDMKNKLQGGRQGNMDEQAEEAIDVKTSALILVSY